jgi:hypothetical protein
MSFRPGSRIFSTFRPFFQRANARRRVNTAAGAEPAGFARFWNSPIGPKTVHFWYAALYTMRFVSPQCPVERITANTTTTKHIYAKAVY